MEIRLERVELNQRVKLEKLLQLYLHDLSLYLPFIFNSQTCEYVYNLDKYFNDSDNNFAYFIKSNQELLGFILINKKSDNNYEVGEIFVLSHYRYKNIGEKAIRTIFNTYKGNWVVKAAPLSLIAESFWKKTLDNYTNKNYIVKHTGKYNRVQFYFNNEEL